MRRTLITTAALACLAVFPSGAAGLGFSSLSRKQAVRAVEKEVRTDYGMRYPDVTCRRLEANLQKCHFWGMDHHDELENDLAGHSGNAYVQRYADGIDVRITGYRRGGTP